MRKSAKLLIPVFLVALVIAGCDNTPTDPQGNMPLTASYAFPMDATLESATLYMYVVAATDNPVTAHRATSSWDEMTVTWNSFGGAFDATVVDGFTANAGWQMTDVTSLVQAWMNGTYANYGMLLDEADDQTPRTIYASSESTEYPNEGPWVEVCYTVSGDPMVYCDTIEITTDVHISEFDPNTNFGDDVVLYTGRPYLDGPVEKQTLLYFELEVTEPEYAAIGDFVWYDNDMDGIQDAGEPGVEGVKVYLMDCEGMILDSMYTDADGYYLFDSLMPGYYNIRFMLPNGYVWTLQDQGMDDAMDSDADMNGFAICTELVAGETDLTWDAGIYMPEQEGCTRTPGYWSNWTGLGPQPDMVTQYLPIWLGDAGGAKSIAVTDVEMAVEIFAMMTYGGADNGIAKLYRHLLATKLNLAAGASGDDLGTAVADADAFLAMYDWMDWDSLTEEQQEMVEEWKDLFDEYNNGEIGPGSCDSFEDEDEGEGIGRGRG